MSSNLIPFIDLKTQYALLKGGIQKRIECVLEHGQYIMGPEVAELEKRLAEFTGAKNCISVGSGTEALLISLLALGVKPGDEVITTSFTFAATAEVISLLGAKPIFADVSGSTCNIDADLIESLITPRTKCIMPVSLYGQPADFDAINVIAKRNGNIPVIEDGAQSFGAVYHGKRSGNLSSIGCTSFFPSKPLGCYGDGGAIFTNDDLVAQACREIRVHGQSKRYLHSRIGICGRMDTIQCAVVLAKLDAFEWELVQRGIVGERYNQAFDKAGIERVQKLEGCSTVFAQYTIFVDDRDEVQRKLMSLGIPTSIHYPIPLNEQPAYRVSINQTSETPVAHALAKRVLSLPMGPYLTEVDQLKVIKSLAPNA